MTQDSSITLSQLLVRFEQQHSKQDEGTRYMRHLAFAQLIAVVGDLPLGEFTLAEAEAYRKALLDGFVPQEPAAFARFNALPARAREGFRRGFKPVTAASYLKMIRRPFRWHQVHTGGFYDQWSRVERVKIPKARVRVYSDVQLGELLRTARALDDHGLTEARILVMATSGLRRAEGQHLLDSDIDWQGGTITVQAHAETATTFAWRPKDIDCRTVPLVDQARDALQRRRQVLPKQQPYLLQSEERYAYLLWRRGRGEMTDRQRKTLDENWVPFERVRDKAGTQGLSQKHLRSTFATNCLRDGIDLRSVQELMGHESIETTEKYLAPEASAIEKARSVGAARLSRLGA